MTVNVDPQRLILGLNTKITKLQKIKKLKFVN